ncbi:SusC/RagA family TonB-linked outer membrane protein [Flavihumibacter sp. RY-1]|uniref:SusC/RagA family TonB-linked outer membrane protein n=1 Tax=Flavihumibacter fluminis TaxID=2909236 RepID=A0ABS9BGC1_9BACT|nr:SusC/RagA family TonB-linked outer membrane protein [Flavihumibacter fluminis]MCF1714113.1 SusC/RagA family TonB-linked outer membrane protein [Flavihumibacter fluminis]
MTTKSKLLSWSLCCLLLLCTLAQIQAQSPGGAVTGTVRNAQSEPLPGSTVKLENSSNRFSRSTQADANGNFRFEDVPFANGYRLTISNVGYTDKVISGLNHSSANLLRIQQALEESAKSLDEMVVVGYGKTSKRDLTGAVKSIKAEEFNKGIINSPEELLQGKVAGVNVTASSGEPGAPQSITIRGPGGVRTGSTPLFVIDGMALDNSSTGGAVNPLTFLNPQDIESMDVLKDASATAIYGARGANGVVLITTKKGRSGFSSVNYNFTAGVSKIANPLPLFSTEEYKRQVVALGGELEDFGGSTNWQDEITRTAFTQNHNLAVSGGVNKLTYYASLGMQLQEGVIQRNDLKRYNGRINITQKLWDDRLTLDINLNANNTVNRRPNIGSLIGGAISTNPTIPARNADGTPYVFENGINPLKTLELEKDWSTINRVIGNVAATLKIIKGLEYKVNIGIDNSTGVRDVQSLPNAVPQRDGRLETYNTYNKNVLMEHYFTYNFNINNLHKFTALAGYSFQDIYLQGRGSSINRFPIGGVEPIYNPGTGQELTLANNRPSGYAVQNELQSFFGRLNYNFDNRYLFTATLRADGSSKFGENNKYGIFPSFSAAWNIAQEKFFNSTWISSLKLRGGWGQTGNQEIPAKITQPLFTATVSGNASYPLDAGTTYPAGVFFTRLANPNIQWEVSTQIDLGFDFGLFNGALNGTVDYFRKVTNNILLQVPPADPVQPAATTWSNIKDMNIVNQGVEIDLNYQHRKGPVNYTIGGNITFIDNVVKNSPYTVIPSGSASGSGLTSATINGYINGSPIGAFYLLDFTGFDRDGLSVYRDANQDGFVNDRDRVVLGTALPKRIFSLYGTMGYKAFDLAINFNGVSGNKLYDNTENAGSYKALIAKGVNTFTSAVKYPEESTTNDARVSSRFLKDGSFFRLNNLALGYTLPMTKVGNGQFIKQIRFSLTGQNLFVITKYDGFDPEVNADRNIDNVLSYGVDYLSYPRARSFILGINVQF